MGIILGVLQKNMLSLNNVPMSILERKEYVVKNADDIGEDVKSEYIKNNVIEQEFLIINADYLDRYLGRCVYYEQL